MTETEKKALALLNEVEKEMGLEKVSSLELDMPGERALLRAIEQHEAFRQEVSDAVEKHLCTTASSIQIADVTRENLARFSIAKADPLVEVINDADDMVRKPDAPSYAEAIRAALAARGLEIREKQ